MEREDDPGHPMFVVDGDVGLEKSLELLSVGTELDVLNYKRELDLSKSSPKNRPEFAKDVAAFSTLHNGGYRV